MIQKISISSILFAVILFIMNPGMTYAWDLSTASYDSVSFSVQSQAANPLGITFKSDGTKMYAIDHTTDRIYQYSLSSAWDISTASYDSLNGYVGGQATQAMDVEFKSDGTKMYIVDSFQRAVYQYSLSSAWDVSTLSYDSVVDYIGSQENGPRGIAFKTDGTKMYISGDSGDEVNEFSLSSAWDLSTASASSIFDFSNEDGSPMDIEFKSDGTKMYMMGYDNERVFQYSLSTVWDVTSASYDGVSTYVGSQEVTPWDVHIGSNGTKMYIIGNSYDKVFQYTLTPDSTDPTIFSLSPLDDATSITMSSNLMITFDEAVDVESGNISIYKTTGDELVEAIDVTGLLVTGNGTTEITINPTEDFEESTEYYVLIDVEAFDDTAGNSFTGIADTTTWSFTTLTRPYVVSVDPLNGSTGVSNEPVFTVTFSEAINTGEPFYFSTDPCNFNGACATPSITAWSNGDTVATIQNGNGAYAYDTTYTMTINQLISAATGADIAVPYDWVFTIESAPAVSSRSSSGSTALSRDKAKKMFAEYYAEEDVSENTVEVESSDTSEEKVTEEVETIITETIFDTFSIQAVISSGGLLRRGSKGSAIIELQNILNKLGAETQLTVDGDFGRLTHEAVEAFQREKGLKVDGVVGKQTLENIL